MRDFLEHLEAAGEAEFERMTKGVPDGHFRCACGRIVPLSEGHPYSANPYSMPICGSCLEEIAKQAQCDRAATDYLKGFEQLSRTEAEEILRANGVDSASLRPRFIERIRRDHPELLATIGEE